MTVLVNGQPSTTVSANDRGLLYGQTLFETIAVVNAQPRLLEAHLQRLEASTKSLLIPLNINNIDSDIEVISDFFNASHNAVLRVTISMGSGGRGYANPELPSVTRIVSLHDYPKHPAKLATHGITLGLSPVKLAQQPLLAGLKHGNRLEQVMARSQWQTDWNEALLCDQSGNVIEGTQSNIVVLKGDQALSPKLDQCGVEGVMKGWVLSQLKDAGFSCRAVRLSLQDIIEADEVMLTNSVIGIWPVKTFHCKGTAHSFVIDKPSGALNTAQRLIEQLHQNEIIPPN